MFGEFRADAARRDAVILGMFKRIHTVGLAIVKTLNRHTRILEHNTQILAHNTRILENSARSLERMDRKLGARDNGRPGPNGGRA